MLRRFELIKECGIFEGFRWDASVPDFERINLIYGANGSGKTSLARALDGLGRDSGGFAKVSIRMSNIDKANDRQSNLTYDAEFEKVYVFSDNYVTRNHNFSGNTEIEAVLTLGERTVEDEKRISELNELIKALSGDLIKVGKIARDAARALDDEYTSIARGVVTALSRAGGEYRSNGSYSQARAKARFAGSHASWALLNNNDKAAALATVNSDERQTVPTKPYSYAVRSDLIDEILVALSASPVSVVLDTLKGHEEASNWVETGRHIHKELNRCIFCGGKLTNDRKLEIEQHFSDEVEKLQRIIDSLIEEIMVAQGSVKKLLGDNAIAGLLFIDLREEFKAEYKLVKLQADALETWLGEVLEALKLKRTNVLAPIKIESMAPPKVDGSKIENVIGNHNNRVSQHASLVQEAAEKVEWHLLKASEDKIKMLDERSRKAANEKLDVDITLKKYREELAALENIEGNPLPSAEVMSKELTRILGRNELSFELMQDGKHYRVTRYGKPACDLSTGERTAITLIHFLENVKRAKPRSGKSIIVIDDPVSSLDSSASMGISTYIWSETISKDHIEQVFLLTHNFELFRQWDIQLDVLPRNASKKYPSNCYELIAPHHDVNGIKRRVPEFIIWPPNDATRKKVRSAYHHAFITAARARAALALDSSIEKKLDALLLYPNVLRRMLETFLAFKIPNSVGDFTGSMREIGDTLEDRGYNGDADALRLHLTRFTHANSHAESPETDVAVNPDEIEAVIASVFTFMNAVDQPHFEGLCKAVGVKPSDLLLNAQPVVNQTEVAN